MPTHIVHAHFHFDHLGGTRGFLQQADSPEIIMTQTTRKLAYDAYLKTQDDPNNPGLKISAIEKWGGNLTDASLIIEDENKPMILDLGGRSVTITPMSGHTASDLVIFDQQTQATFAGDYRNGQPNYHPRSWQHLQK